MDDVKLGNALREPAAPFVISSTKDAYALLSSGLKRWTGSRRNVVVNIAGLPASEQQHWGARLSFWLNVCGCQTGALFAVLTIVCVIASPGKVAAPWITLLADFSYVVAAALVGKVVGLVAARLMLALDLKRLIRQTSSNAFKTGEG